MGNKSYLILSGLLLLSILFWSACNNPGSSLEESVEPYLELESIEEASSTTVAVNKGSAQGFDSFFAFDLSNIKPNGFISNGLKEGWCLEWNKPLNSNNDVQTDVEVFNTRGSDSWKPANYLMNIKDDLQSDDPELTYREIQVALWSLIEVPAFDIDKALTDGTMPPRMMTNGVPNFSVEKTKQIVSRVRSEVSNFEYKANTPVIAYMNIDDDLQNTGTVVGNTMFAYGDGKNGSFTCNTTELNMDRWGWVFNYDLNGGKKIHDFLAGAGSGNEDCNADPYEPGGTQVGVLEITYDDPILSLNYKANEGLAFQDPHIWIGCNRADITSISNGQPPSGYPYPDFEDNIKFNEKTFDINISSLSCYGSADNIYVSAHAGND